MSWFMRVIKATGLHIRTTLFAGLVIIVPVGVTFLILKYIFDFFDPVLKPIFTQFVDWYTPGMGIVSLAIVIYLVGLVTTHVLGRRIIDFGHRVVDRVPVVNTVYRAARQATDVFSNVNSKSKFTSVVLVDFPGYGLRSLGLVTSNIKDQYGNTLLVVYMPTSPFPTSGFLVILPENQVTPTDIPVDDAMKLIISAGVVAPEKISSYSNFLENFTPPAEYPFAPGGVKSPRGEAEQSHSADSRDSNQ